ncbi:MAG TPA: amidohydrolase family protein [Pyrinomonadaceae bacterium]|nr:amidohydrolase family protein [Pyrinomonadaceae bacterium]
MEDKRPAPPPRRRARPVRAPLLTRKRLLILLVFVVTLGVGLGLTLYWGKRKLTKHFDVLIVGGTIIDGTGAPPRTGTLGIAGGRIVPVEWDYFAEADRVIDARGKIVAPGFVDVHTHIERSLQPGQTLAAENFLVQGFTTIITGNCGTSAPSLPNFFRQLETSGTALNVATLVGHNTVRRQVIGQATRAASADELVRMREAVERAMQEGALGFSTGLEYSPGQFAPTSEVEVLAAAAGRYQGIYATHMRDEGNDVVRSLEEALSIARKANVALDVSHLKARGRTNWGTAARLVQMIEQARQTGLRVTCDAYPYTASSTTLDLLIPKREREQGGARLRERLRNAGERLKVVASVLEQMRGEGWQDFSFARVAYCDFAPEFNGLTIPEIAARLDRNSLANIPAAPPSASKDAPVSDGDAEVVQSAEEVRREGTPPASKGAPAAEGAKETATPAASPAKDSAEQPKQTATEADKARPADAERKQPADSQKPKEETKEKPKAPANAPPESVKPPAAQPFMLQIAATSQSSPTSAESGVFEQAEAICYLYARGGAQMIFENMSASDVADIVRFPGCMLGSDSGVRVVGEGRPHPRGFGSAPRFLGLFAREQQLLTWEEAIRRMSALPAETFALAERGKLLPGYHADVVIFDPATIKDRATYDSPFQSPEGIAYVIVNGQVAVEGGKLVTDKAGKVIKRQGV